MTDWMMRTCPAWLGAWAAWVQRWRYGVLAVAVVLTLAAVVGVQRNLGISTDTVDMISPEEPFRQHAKAFNDAFPGLNNAILAVVDGPTPEAADIAAERFADRMRGAESVQQVYQPAGSFLRQNAFLFLKQDKLGRVLDRLASAEPVLAALAEQPNMAGLADMLRLAAERREELPPDALSALLSEMAVSTEAMAEGRPRKLSWQALFAPADGEQLARTQQFVIVQPELDYDRLKPASEAIAAARAAQAGVNEGGAGRVRLTGEAVIEHQELITVESSGVRAALLSLVAVAAILLIGLRAPRLVTCSLITLVLGLIWTAGIAAVVVGELNLISVAFAVLFLGLGIDFCIHFALRYREERRNGTAATIAATGRGVGCALLLSAVCAALGFFSFLPTAYRGLAELGLIAGIGMFVAVGASLTVLPALLAVWRPRRGFGEPPHVVAKERRLVANHGRKVLLGALIVGVVGLVLASRTTFDFNPMNLRDPDASSIQVFNEIAGDPDTTPYVVNVLAESPDAAQRVAERFRTAEGFGRVRTLASYVPENQDAKLAAIEEASFFLAPLFGARGERNLEPAARRDAYRTIRESLATLAAGEDANAEAAQRVLTELDRLGDPPDLAALNARWTDYLPRTLDFVRGALSVEGVERDDLPADLAERWVSADGQARVQVQPATALEDNAALRAFAQRALDVDPRATGAPVIIHEASNAVVAAFRQATTYAVIAIVLLLAVTLRHLPDVLLALAPLALASVLTLGTAVLAGIALNFANVIVLPLLLGLGVSSGIHLVLRARQVAAIDQVFATSTPRAVLLSVLTTLASFGTLVLSDHKGMSSMGALLTLAITFILISVLVVLPCLIAAVAPYHARGTGVRAARKD
ncbi:hypothetical protein SAMN05216241_102421 [Limimonas halophila]|uniref:Membrane transport protein MMPL domain-containing protein n=1 Tax=Limimonas halophila TaxID=1082479 RepID=A0A1G7P3T3_9PROT|nr:MMPL family transporter [Limimonas halophila]SDF80955.1 hypothetical protein SAMN05216241_102421 [Limimonas halophila]